jgi:divalent metal cation (Fe/Co/Zn/Cd) transporter
VSDSCGRVSGRPSVPPADLAGRRLALRLAWVTVAYNVLEGVVSILAGAAAGSMALVGFGLDSFVESLSGGVVIWRFSGRGGLSAEEEARREHRAVRLIGWSFFVLAAWIGWESFERLVRREAPEPSLIGLAVAAVSLVVMPVLFLIKRRAGLGIGSRSVVADSKQTLACSFLSAALLAGLGLNYRWGVWWADPAVGLLVAVYLVREGFGAVRGGELCSC